MNSTELLSLPFDQYQRYRLLAEIIERIRPDVEPLRILDVGGYLQGGGQDDFLPVNAFLPHDRIIVADVKHSGPGRYIVASGEHLPFGDSSFDIVTALDTLEHLPSHVRRDFVHELCRTAGLAVIIIGPVYSLETRLAEEVLDQGIRYYINAVHPALKEHLDYGLPRTGEIREWLQEAGMHTHDFPDGFLPNWLFMMLMIHSFMQKGGAEELIRQLNRFYNVTIGKSDRRAPAYRQAFIAAREPLDFNESDFQNFDSGEMVSGELSGFIMTSLMMFRETAGLNRKADDFHAIHRNYLELVKLSEERLRLIHEKDEIINRQLSLLSERDRINADLDRVRLEKDDELNNRHRHIAGLESELAASRQEVTAVKQEMENMQKSLNELKAFRDRIIGHPAYRIFKKFKR